MARKEQVVVLRVAYDDTEAAPPETWDWHDLIDCPREDVGILLTGDLIEKTEIAPRTCGGCALPLDECGCPAYTSPSNHDGRRVR